MVASGAWARGAASTDCGVSCVSLYNQKSGSADVSAVSGGTAAVGQAVILAAAANRTSEDWTASFQGVVSDYYAAGLMNATPNQYYGSDLVYEFEYAPGAIDSGLCLVIASGPRQSTKVTLQPCGVSVNTAWIFDAADANAFSRERLPPGKDERAPSPVAL